jgi:hypothetical protein
VRGSRPQLHLPGKEPFNTFLHLIGGFVGERHRENILRRHLPGLDQIDNPIGDDTSLPTAGSSQDKQRPFRLFYGGALLGIKLVEEIGHSEVKSRGQTKDAASCDFSNHGS